MATKCNGASKFNQDIGGWDVRKVSNMAAMFYNASAFKHDISRWKVTAVTNFASFMLGVTLPTAHYNRLLIRWSQLALKPGLDFHAGASKYDNGRPAECRAFMVNLAGNIKWKITDGGSTGNLYKEPGTVVLMR